MAFTDFSNTGYRLLTPEIIAALAALGATQGLSFSLAGGSLGNGEMTIKLKVKSTNQTALADNSKNEFKWACRHVGLEPEDHGAVFSFQGKQFKLTGVHTSRPKYPISGECMRTGRSFKFPRHTANAIIAVRAVDTAPPVPPMALPGSQITPTTSVEDRDDRYAAGAMF